MVAVLWNDEFYFLAARVDVNDIKFSLACYAPKIYANVKTNLPGMTRKHEMINRSESDLQRLRS